MEGPGEGVGQAHAFRGQALRLLLDTHFLLWILLDSPRLEPYAWLDRYLPWGVSPVSLLEMQFLAETGRLELAGPEFYETLLGDSRFTLDEPPLFAIIRQALSLSWTRDPFDRLLAAHSLSRRVPLCTVDAALSRHHSLVVPELRR
jgi:PIN domain nuclease of toxin-antitoxin system